MLVATQQVLHGFSRLSLPQLQQRLFPARWRNAPNFILIFFTLL
jgi:hypothetical protein